MRVFEKIVALIQLVNNKTTTIQKLAQNIYFSKKLVCTSKKQRYTKEKKSLYRKSILYKSKSILIRIIEKIRKKG